MVDREITPGLTGDNCRVDREINHRVDREINRRVDRDINCRVDREIYKLWFIFVTF